MARDLCTKPAWDLNFRRQKLGSSLVRFDMALQPTDLILELPARPLERIVESKMNVRMPLVETWRTPDIDLLSVRERQADVDLVEAASAVVFARCLHHHPAAVMRPKRSARPATCSAITARKASRGFIPWKSIWTGLCMRTVL
jgi:hypothetical protein